MASYTKPEQYQPNFDLTIVARNYYNFLTIVKIKDDKQCSVLQLSPASICSHEYFADQRLFQCISRLVKMLASRVLLSLDVIYTSKYCTTIENEKVADLTGLHGATFSFDLPAFGIPNTITYGQAAALTTFNGRFGLFNNDDTWEVYLWGRNLTNESYSETGVKNRRSSAGERVHKRQSGLLVNSCP